jgi:hypothetical protein
MSQSAVSRIWRAFVLKPHIVQTWNWTVRKTVRSGHSDTRRSCSYKRYNRAFG